MNLGTERNLNFRRSDIINIVTSIILIGTLIWGSAIVKAQVDTNTAWIEANKQLPSCIEKMESWLIDNKNLPADVLTVKLSLEYIVKDMKNLAHKLEITNKNLTFFNKEFMTTDKGINASNK